MFIQEVFLEQHLSKLRQKGTHEHDNSGRSSSEEILRSIFFFKSMNKACNDSTVLILVMNTTLFHQKLMTLDSMDKH